MYIKLDEDDYARVNVYFNLHPDTRLTAEELRTMARKNGPAREKEFNAFFGRLMVCRLRGAF